MHADKQYRPWNPDQSELFAPSPRQWLPPEHLVWFLLDVVAQLDLSAMELAIQQKDARGTRPYHPRMMTALLLYGYCLGVFSSRKLERATYTDVAFRVLTGGAHPDHSGISEFRRAHLKALDALFEQVLRLCQEAGLVKLAHVALDGTKVKANASKHKAMSYERMKKTQAELAAEVKAMLERAEAVDREEDALYGKDRRGDELPEELARRETRLAKIKEAMAKLEAEAAAAKARELRERAEQSAVKAQEASENEKAKAQAKAHETKAKAQRAAETAEAKAAAAGEPSPDLTPRPQTALPSHQVAADAEGNPSPKAQRNFTDPESRIMKQGGDFVQGYNAQLIVDDANQVIVARAVTNQAPDVEHLPPMIGQIEERCGRLPEKLTADSGYFSETNAAFAESKGVDPYIATGRDKHAERSATDAHPSPMEGDSKARMRQKLSTPEGRAVYARPKAIVEPVFGQIKEARGFRRFLLRGVDKIRREWSLVCTTHNLLKLFRATFASTHASPAPAAA